MYKDKIMLCLCVRPLHLMQIYHQNSQTDLAATGMNGLVEDLSIFNRAVDHPAFLINDRYVCCL